MADVPDLYPGEPPSVRLMNTVWADRSGVHDSLLTTGQLAAWWSLIGFEPAVPATDDALGQYRQLRGALRRLAAQATDDSRGRTRVDETSLEDALAMVNAWLASGSPNLRWDAGTGFVLAWAEPASKSVQDHLASLAREGAQLLTVPDAKLRACYGPGCVLYFVREHSRREWCSPGCGNRARVARHYRRVRSGEGGTVAAE
ncbi:CGNR zinc finger domain-containing protein [Phytoactinopolyspora halotolerans]|uniref:Zinc finger CGNR domain-containing protein n=1 Tax=Phytoactinopolyspora halotolerans TaxID=1981512 RepID=A0A6L9S6B9_9ACTN|nr:ABATE domain-containing protein [Phytoactinopolyspora halotolerans]NEE01005.1 hypothetical protein [Phytoactinopolyspora halotolerans]